MKRVIAMLIMTAALSGCATVQSWIPSFWDDNQSRSAVDIRLAVERIDCGQPQAPQIDHLNSQIRWFQLYSESKGSLQQDVLRIMAPMKLTVDEWSQRLASGREGSTAYCEIKKKLLTTQSRMAAEAVLGRY